MGMQMNSFLEIFKNEDGFSYRQKIILVWLIGLTGRTGSENWIM